MGPVLGTPNSVSGELVVNVLLSSLDRECEELIRSALSAARIQVTVAENVFDALFGDTEPIYGCLILGESVANVRQLRMQGVQFPILVILSDGTVDARVEALAMGSDDCLGFPFSVSELVARTQALLRRRGRAYDETTLMFGDLSLCSETCTAERNGDRVHLTPTEAELLRLFLENRGRVLSPHQIAETLWGADADVSFNLVSVHVANLRRKLAFVLSATPIQTLRGRGYVIHDLDSPALSKSG